MAKSKTQSNTAVEVEKTTKVNDVEKTVETEKEIKIVDDEKEMLKAQIEELKSQMALMAQMVSNKPAQKTSSNKMIRFINLVRGTLVLKGSRVWTIEGQFNSIEVSEAEANTILSISSNIIHSGYVYINDREFVEEHNLSDIYRTILSDEDMKTLLRRNAIEIIDLYKSTSEQQQEVIIDMIIDKIQRGIAVDANVLKELGKLSGKDLLNLETEPED